MSARPRLVHEGDPIDVGDDTNDTGWLNQEYEKEVALHHQHEDQYDSTTQTSLQSSLQQSSARSSLSLADYRHGSSSRRQAQAPSRKIQTRIEIGNPQKYEAFESQPDDSMMEMEDVDHYEAYASNASNTFMNAYTNVQHHPTYMSHASLPATLPFQETQTIRTNPTTNPTPTNPSRHHYEIGKQPSSPEVHHERMEIEDILPKPPLVVIDGANVAYAYSTAYGLNGTSTSLTTTAIQSKVEPDALGIKIAAEYFLNAGCRCQVVLPTQWMRRKPRPGDEANGNALMATEQLDILKELDSHNILCLSPPTDDDDAYCLAMAQRESSRALVRSQQQQRSLNQSIELSTVDDAFILSNDWFRDAMKRDGSNELKQWLQGSNGGRSGSSNINQHGHRISYSFCDLDSIDQYGDRCLEFLPNPRHLLINLIEKQNRGV